MFLVSCQLNLHTLTLIKLCLSDILKDVFVIIILSNNAGSDCDSSVLQVNSEMVRQDLGDLVMTLKLALQAKKVSIQNIIRLLGIGLGDASISSISNLFTHLRLKGYLPFYHLVLLEKIINEFAEECRPALEEYKSKCLKPYLDKCWLESDGGSAHTAKQKMHLRIPVDRQWDTMCIFDEKSVCESLAEMYNLPNDKMRVEVCYMKDQNKVGARYY